MGVVEIGLLVLMVVVIVAALARITEIRRARAELATKDHALSALRDNILGQMRQKSHWRAKTEEANDALAAAEAKIAADLRAALPLGSGSAVAAGPTEEDGAASARRPPGQP